MSGGDTAVSAIAETTNDAFKVGMDGAICSCSDEYAVRVWFRETGANTRTLLHTNLGFSLSVSLDGMVYSGTTEDTVGVLAWSPEDGVLLNAESSREGIACVFTMKPNGEMSSGSYDGTVREWIGETGARMQKLKSGPALALAVTYDGAIHVAGISSSTISIDTILMW